MTGFLSEYKHWFIGGAAVLVIGWNIAGGMHNKGFDTFTVETPEEFSIEPPEADAAAEERAAPELIMVEVKGAVKSPGVYELPKDARVKNLLDLAGLSPGANLLHVNQSMKLTDEMVIFVPTDADVEEMPKSVLIEESSVYGINERDGGVININTADKERLMMLNGIGDKTADAIIEYRETNGLFMHTEDIKQVSGIGEKKYQAIEPDITVE